MSTAASAAARWSRRWMSSSSSSSCKDRFLFRPLGSSSRGLETTATNTTTSCLRQATSSLVTASSSSSSAYFSSDATATAANTASSNSNAPKTNWSANIKRSRKVIQALEQLPSNLRFDARSTCIPLLDDDATKSTRPSPLVGVSDDEEQEEDDDTVIEQQSKSTTTRQRQRPSSSSPTVTTNTTITTEGVVVAIPLPQRLQVSVHNVSDKTTPIDTITLPAHIFGRDPIRIDLIKRAVDYQRNRQRGKRKALAKTISMVSGSGHKVRAQKRTGSARAGHKRPPHWRGGAVAHGPKGSIQDYGDTKLNGKVRQLAVQHVLSQKLKEQNLIVVDQIQEKLSSHHTKKLAALLKKWQIGGRFGKSALILDVVVVMAEKEEDAASVPKVDETEPVDKATSSEITAALTTTTTTAHRTITPQHIHQGGGLPVNLKMAAGNLAHVQTENVWYANVYNILKYEKIILTLPALQVLEKRFESSSF